MKAPALLGLALAFLTGCATSPPVHNPLFGDWVIDLPTLPRAHGNRIGFRDDCLIVGGDRVGTEIVRPVAYLMAGTDTFVWFGAAARGERRSTGNAARVSSTGADRISVVWPEGIEARYLRVAGSAAANADCR